MSRIPRQAKRDAVEPDVIAVLEAAGLSVMRHSAKGEPDLLVFRGPQFVALVECKSRRGALTEPQAQWRARWQGPPPVTVRSVEDALALLRESR